MQWWTLRQTHFEETAVEDVAVLMENPLLYGEGIADALKLFRLEEPYQEAAYRNSVPVDYELNTNVPKRVVEAEERFVGRHVRTSTTHPATGRKTKLLGTIQNWSGEGRNLCKIVYKDGSWQEMDIEELHQYMVRSVKKGDHVDEDGWTAQEVYQIVVSFAAMLQEVELQREESHFFADSKSEGFYTCDSFKWCLASAGPIYDDEPQTTNQINAHPEAPVIRRPTQEVLSKLKEHKIGYPINENDLPKGTKFLPTKFVIKRKYLTDENKNEVFDKWKARLVLRGDLQKENVDVFNLFSATPSFSAIRLILSLFTDPTMSVESYDLVSAFLVPKLKGSFIVTRLPPNEDGSQGQVLALLVAMYGLKDAPVAILVHSETRWPPSRTMLSMSQ